jgi:hypothetical protein
MSQPFAPTRAEQAANIRHLATEIVSGQRRLRVGQRAVLNSGVTYRREKLELGEASPGLYRNNQRVDYPEDHPGEIRAVAADLGIE